MDINKIYSGETFKADDLGDNEPTFQINSVEVKQFDNGNKLVIGVAGEKKKLVCNKTNAKRIAHMFGGETDNWIGQSITLYVEHVDFQGNIVPAIRVKVMKRPVKNIPPQRARPSSAEMGRYQQDNVDDDIPF